MKRVEYMQELVTVRSKVDVCETDDWWVASNTLCTMMSSGTGWRVFAWVRVCLWQVVNYTTAFVRSPTFPHMHTDHRPDRQVLISRHGCCWCVLTETVAMTESLASEQRGMLGLTRGSLSFSPAVCLSPVCGFVWKLRWKKMSVGFSLANLWICQRGKD